MGFTTTVMLSGSTSQVKRDQKTATASFMMYSALKKTMSATWPASSLRLRSYPLREIKCSSTFVTILAISVISTATTCSTTQRLEHIHPARLAMKSFGVKKDGWVSESPISSKKAASGVQSSITLTNSTALQMIMNAQQSASRGTTAQSIMDSITARSTTASQSVLISWNYARLNGSNQ